MKMHTLAIIKPDAVKAGNMGKIISIIESKGLEIEKATMLCLPKGAWESFYAEHLSKPFYTDLVRFMASGPVVAMSLCGEDAIKAWRDLMGPSDPTKAGKSTIRGQFGTKMPMNAVHGSDSIVAANRELDFFF